MKKTIFILTLFICSSIEAQTELINLPSQQKGRDLVYDSITDKIYITIPSADTENGNSIGIINPYTNTLENALYVGDEPTEMAISDNGQYIYVAFNEVAKVKRYTLNPLSFDMEFELGTNPNADPADNPAFFARNIEVMPGNPDVIAVARKLYNNSSQNQGVGIYDNGVMRPNDYLLMTGTIGFNAIKFKDSNMLIGHATSSPSKLGIFNIDEQGLNLEAVYDDMPNPHPYGVSSDFIHLNDKLYFMNGRIINISSAPYLEGQMTSNLFDLGAVVYDNTNNLICYGNEANLVTYYENGLWNGYLKRFNPITKELYDSNKITTYGPIDKIITCGNSCYAMLTNVYGTVTPSPNQLTIVRFGNLSVDDLVKEPIVIYPNPSPDVFNINSQEIDTIYVYDFSGKKISELKNTNQIDLSNYSNGIYFCKVISHDGNIFTEKIVKK